ncbi:MAG: hypothetical protein JWO15_3321 [Sphingomonadales bacterium]|nr:hypothetical protein [Sphingomonadales bacterium]
MFHYRRRVPSDLTAVLGKREIWRTLETDSRSAAIRRLHRVAASVEAEFEQARTAVGRTLDPTLLKPLTNGSLISMALIPPGTLSVPTAESSVPPIRSIGEVYDRFIDDPRHTWSKRTAIAHTTTRKWIIEAFGAGKAITAISREECREFVELLRHMPSHADKRFPDMAIRDAVAAAKTRGEDRLINAANANAYLNRFGGVLNWALEEGYIDRNPVKVLISTES